MSNVYWYEQSEVAHLETAQASSLHALQTENLQLKQDQADLQEAQSYAQDKIESLEVGPLAVMP